MVFSTNLERQTVGSIVGLGLARFLSGYSVELLPRHLTDIERYREIFSPGTRVYIAQPDGTSHRDVARAARTLREAGFIAMPHLTARAIPNLAILKDVLSMFREEAGVDQALLVAGGAPTPRGPFESSIQLLETGLFEQLKFRRVHVAGHPEGNPMIDGPGSTQASDAALLWKESYARQSTLEMEIVTQFIFDPAVVVRWEQRIRRLGVTLPIRIGVAGPTKLTTLMKYAVACGVGPSLQVLRRKPLGLTNLMASYDPVDLISNLADYAGATPDSLLGGVHLYSFGGVAQTGLWANAVADQARTRALGTHAGSEKDANSVLGPSW